MGAAEAAGVRNWWPELELAVRAVRAAGTSIQAAFRTELKVSHKGPDQPVTEVDLAADALLAETLLGADPGAGWLSEEAADSPARLELDRVWIVDPLDGTRSFVAGYREFAVSVALARSGEVVVGVVYNPAIDDLFWAVRGGGAYRDRAGQGPGIHGGIGGETGVGIGGERVIIPPPSAAARPTVLASRTEIRRGEFEAFEPRWAVRPLGSTAYKLVAVAAGEGSAFVSRGPKSEWDVAAGALILEEAGGVITDAVGRPLRFNRPDPYVHGVVAAHQSAHRELLDMVAGLPSPRLRPERSADEAGGST